LGSSDALANGWGARPFPRRSIGVRETVAWDAQSHVRGTATCADARQ
jgi:hypothetical protein